MGAKTIKLNSGHEMPLVGFGLWKVTNETCAEQVYNAIKTGYRLFDSAGDYGNEKESGEGINRAIKEGLVKREELFITTKVWNAFHDKERVIPMCKKQLKDMGLDYFDLYLIHFPISLEYVDPEVRYPPGWTNAKDKITPGKATLEETWRQMEEIHKSGLAKSIGVSNYNGGLMLDLLRYAKIPPSALQIEHHPYLTQPTLVKFCQDNNIAITAYSSFGPLSFIEIQHQQAANTPLLMENDFVTSIAKKHDKTPAQILLRWATQRNIAVIPKSNNQGRLKQNLEVLDFNLADQEIKQISSLERGLRFNNPIEFGFPIFA